MSFDTIKDVIIENRIQIQIQLVNGNWQTQQYVVNDPLNILQSMKTQKERFKDRRVRAVDSRGMLIDML